MKKFEIVIRGANEEAVAHAVMVGVYGAIRKYKHTDVSVQAATVKEGWVREVDKEPEIQIPEFLNRRQEGNTWSQISKKYGGLQRARS